MTHQTDRDTTVVTHTGSGGSASWFIAGIVLVVVVIGSFFLFGSEPADDNVNVSIEAPAASEAADDAAAAVGEAAEGAAAAVEGAAEAVEDSTTGN